MKETFLRKFVLGLSARAGSRLESLDNLEAGYQKATQGILSLASPLSPDLRSEPILIDPLPGLEKSSQNWSLNGVMEHLLMVTKAIENVIYRLSSEESPNGIANPADVKPKGEKKDYLIDFQAFAPGLAGRIRKQMEIKGSHWRTKARFPHLWFGPLDAKQWFWLLAKHQAIHYRQAQQITKHLQSK